VPSQRRRVPAIIPGDLARPRFFFHLHDGQDLPDHEGTECKDPAEAHTQAVMTSGALLRDLGGRFWDSPDWEMNVTDEQGNSVCDPRSTGTRRAS